MSNMSFSRTFLPILVAMAEPQLPEPTSATFSGIAKDCCGCLKENLPRRGERCRETVACRQ